jgi:hypothetical protein
MSPSGDTDSAREGDVPQALRALILEAFAAARDAGKPDWHRMYAGVLKNRMLTLTSGEFDEAEWDATSFTGLLDVYPRLVRIDRTVKPPIVELTEEALGEVATSRETIRQPMTREHPTSDPATVDSRGWRLRRDLWDAVMAVRDPEAFIWEGGAVVRVPQDQGEDTSSQLRLPTLTGPELDEWQHAFASEHEADERFKAIVDSWAKGDSRTADLPVQLRHLWYARLKRHVRERLEQWFTEHGIEPPADMIELPSSKRAQGAPVSDLRRLVIQCVEVMTDDELRAISLPATVLLRVRRR